ncbi:MAG: addiction module protein [Phycisphaerae bacterium]
MTTNAIKLLEDALGLPDGDRADLAARLIDSLDQEADEDAPSAWDAEIARRIAHLDGGSVRPVPWPEARRTILGMPDGHSDA